MEIHGSWSEERHLADLVVHDANLRDVSGGRR